MDMRYLEWHGGQLRVVVSVPRPLRSIVGKSRLKQGLRTDSVTMARAKRWPVIAQLRAKIEQQAEALMGDGSPMIREALEWRDGIEGHEQMEVRGQPDDEGSVLLHKVIQQRTQAVERDHGPLRAREFHGVATGSATPIALHLKRWLRENAHLAKRTQADVQRTVERLRQWVQAEGYPQTIEGITRKVAGLFISDTIIAAGINAKTGNNRISSLSTYWQWLIKRGLVGDGASAGDNPWRGQSIAKPKAHLQRERHHDKRPFTDDEVRKLFADANLAKANDPLLSDFMMIAALSGMREGEIAGLKVMDVASVADCKPPIEAFRVSKAKTPAGVRSVPIHSELRSIVNRRAQGKAPGDWLFHELPPEEPSGDKISERYMRLTKRFANYRKGLGIHEQHEGQRQSRVDFHSFRRWFITKAEQAGIPPHIIEMTVGHKRQGMSLGLYSGGSSIDQMAACVEAVRLS